MLNLMVDIRLDRRVFAPSFTCARSASRLVWLVWLVRIRGRRLAMPMLISVAMIVAMVVAVAVDVAILMAVAVIVTVAVAIPVAGAVAVVDAVGHLATPRRAPWHLALGDGHVGMQSLEHVIEHLGWDYIRAKRVRLGGWRLRGELAWVEWRVHFEF